MIVSATQKLVDGIELDNTEIKEVFDEIFSGIADEIEASAFLGALKSGEISPELAASAIACANETFKNSSFEFENTLNSVVFENSKNYLDISLAVDLIASANGLSVFKHSFCAPLEVNNSFKVLSKMGINVKNFDKDLFEKTNFGYFYLDCDCTFLKYTKNIFRKIKFDNLLYTIYKFLNPARAKNIVIGVKSRQMADNIARICLNLNYSNIISISGMDELPFVSIEKETYIAEAWKNKIFTYVLNPELLDLKPHSDNSLIVESNEQSADTILSTFQNKEKDQFYDAITLSAATVLYITKKAPSILDGLYLAQKTIDSNLAFEKVEQLQKLNQQKI